MLKIIPPMKNPKTLSRTVLYDKYQSMVRVHLELEPRG